METTEFYHIVDEYKAQNNIVNITEEEITDLFGESFVFPNYYLPTFGTEIYDAIIITDYEVYLLEKGNNIVEPSPRNEEQKKRSAEYYAEKKFYGWEFYPGSH